MVWNYVVFSHSSKRVVTKEDKCVGVSGASGSGESEQPLWVGDKCVGVSGSGESECPSRVGDKCVGASDVPES